MKGEIYREDLSANHVEIRDDHYDYCDCCETAIDYAYENEIDSYDCEVEIDDGIRMRAMIRAVGTTISASICTLANSIMTASCIRNNGNDAITCAVMEIAGSLAKELPDAIKEAACMFDYSGIEQAISSHEVSIVSETQAERDERHAEEMRLEIERMKHREKYDADL